MRKTYFFLLLMLFALPFYAQTDGWYVQVGVFETKVDINYFNQLGSDVYYSNDTYGFHRYYKGVYNDEAEAQQAKNQFSKMGFNGVIVPKNELGNACVCNYIPMPESLLNTIQNIFFDFGARHHEK